MTQRIINTSTSDLVLGAYDNPVTITAGVTVSSATGAALTSTEPGSVTIDNLGAVAGDTFGITLSGAGTLTNSGQITASDTTTLGYTYNSSSKSFVNTSAAVAMGGGTIDNAAGGTISSPRVGIALNGAGSLANGGLVQGYGTFLQNANAYTVGFGAWLLAGGSVTNLQAGTIRGGQYGVIATGQAATVINAGMITAHVLGGVLLSAGGAVTNTPSGQIKGGYYGVRLGADATVLNQGTIAANGTAKVKGRYQNHQQYYYRPQGINAQGASTITNAAGATITNAYVGVWQHGGGALANAGLITGRYGVVQNIGTLASSVTNAAGGTIQASSIGIDIGEGAANVTNAGSIAAPFGILATGTAALPGTAVNSGTIVSAAHNSGAGIQLKAGGTITNLAGGLVTSYWVGLQIGGFANGATTYAPGGTIINAGTVIGHDPSLGNGAAAWINGPGIVINQAGGTIAGGPYGVVSYSHVTVVNQGYIGGSQFAVFASSANQGDRVIVYPGATFGGIVEGDTASVATPNGVLELAAGAGTGTIAGFGTSFTGFGAVTIDPGANWSLGGTIASSQTLDFSGTGAMLTLADPTAMAGTITGFEVGETIALGGITDVVSAAIGPNNLLQVVESSGGTISLQFDPAQTFNGSSFYFTTAAGATDLFAPCFAAGTPILTESGEVPVEALRPGMRVVSQSGRSVPVTWIGHRRLECRRHPRPWDVWPVRVAPGAFGDGAPSRPLWLSPDHAVFAGGVLVPVRYLLNGRTIVQERRDTITYFHVELPAHDVLLAAGLPCESYLDTGNRAAFDNGAVPLALHPDFARTAWAQGGCAELVLAGPRMVALRERLLRRAEHLGHRRTGAPALRVMAAGKALRPGIAGRRWQVTLPPDTTLVRLRSRAWVPAETRPDATDTRVLGVALAAITLDGIEAGPERFGAGWHADEDAWRWTSGDGVLVAAGARTLAFDLVLSGTYWAETGRRLSPQAAATT